MGVPQNTMSAHLAVLSRAGVVRGARHSRSILYRADLDRVGEIARFLVEDCCGGRTDVCAPLFDELKSCCPPKVAARD